MSENAEKTTKGEDLTTHADGDTSPLVSSEKGKKKLIPNDLIMLYQ